MLVLNQSTSFTSNLDISTLTGTFDKFISFVKIKSTELSMYLVNISFWIKYIIFI